MHEHEASKQAADPEHFSSVGEASPRKKSSYNDAVVIKRDQADQAGDASRLGKCSSSSQRLLIVHAPLGITDWLILTKFGHVSHKTKPKRCLVCLPRQATTRAYSKRPQKQPLSTGKDESSCEVWSPVILVNQGTWLDINRSSQTTAECGVCMAGSSFDLWRMKAPEYTYIQTDIHTHGKGG